MASMEDYFVVWLQWDTSLGNFLRIIHHCAGGLADGMAHCRHGKTITRKSD